ncbi:unnamed protein product [Mytilus edulis]|uniref:BACK domain-containing protein n=1 Tax=Mytilus edulis TaxID=6550 RepID=A0A8S3UGS3_MYTED|nr:unnamed protein product [Mytilus edulis]
MTATSEHAAKTLQTAYKYHLPELLQESLQHIELNTKACLLSEHVLVLPKECVDIILTSDYLSCSETDVCQFFLKWTKSQCDLQKIEATGQNMRNLVGQTLYQIRFPVVDMDFFSKEIANTDFLSSDEMIAIYRSQYGIGTSNFINNKRRGPIEKRQVHTVTRYTDYSEMYNESEGTEAISFQTDTDIWLKGVHLFSNDSYVDFKITDATNAEVYVHTTETDGDYGFTSRLIKLSKPVQILSGKEYTLLTTQHISYGMYYGIHCSHSVKAPDSDVSITFKNSPICTGISNVDQGQFAGFTFSV